MAAPKALRKKSLAEANQHLQPISTCQPRLTCQSGSRRVRISVLYIVDDGREQQGGARAEDRRENSGSHPVCSARRPGEREEAQWKTERSNKGRRESQLRGNLAVGCVVSRDPPVPKGTRSVWSAFAVPLTFCYYSLVPEDVSD